MADENLAPRAHRPDPLSILWRVFGAPQTLMILLGLVAMVLAVASFIPQVPPSVHSDPQAWLVALPGLPGRVSGLLWALRLVDLAHAPWLRLLLALTGVVILVRMVDAADLAWRATGRPRWTAASFRFWAGHAPPQALSSSLSLDETRARLQQHLSAHGYRTAAVPDCAVASVVASRRSSAAWTRPLAYLGMLVALAGLYLVGTWGWQSEDWQPHAGEAHPVGHGTPYVLRLDAFGFGQGETGQPIDPRSQVSWLQGETVVGQEVVRTGHRAMLQGLAVRQIGYLPAVKVRGWDEAGRPLVLQTEGEEAGIPAEAEITFPTAKAQPLLFLPRQEAFLAFRFDPACPGTQPVVAIDWVESDGSGRRTMQVISASGLIVADGLRLEVDLAYQPVLRVDYRPGMALALVGLVVALVASVWVWILTPRLVWFTIAPEEDGTIWVRAVALPGTGDSRWLQRLTAALHEELGNAV